VAGDGVPGDRDGPAGQARFQAPTGIAVDARGRVIVADTFNDRVRAIEPDGTVSTIAGSGAPGLVEGPAAASAFDTPSGVAVDPAFNIYVADSGNVAIRRISPDGLVTSVPHHGLVRPAGVAIATDGVLYAAGDDRIVAVDPDGAVRMVAGSTPGFADGWGSDARFRSLAGIVAAPQAQLLAADSMNAMIRRIRVAPAAEPLALNSVEESLPPPLPPSPVSTPAFPAESFGLLPSRLRRRTASPAAVSPTPAFMPGWTSPRPRAPTFSRFATEQSPTSTACRPSARSTRRCGWVPSPTCTCASAVTRLAAHSTTPGSSRHWIRGAG
jgi:hypothetical protein